MKINLIYATDPNGIIGIVNEDGKLDQPFHSKKDFLWFKFVTEDSTIIMGNNTYKAIGKVLPNRLNIVITSNPEQIKPTANLIAVSSIKEAINVALKEKKTEVYFIGGAIIFEQVYPLVDNIYVTKYNQYADLTNNISENQTINFIPPERYDLALISDEYFEDMDTKTGEQLSGSFQIYRSLFQTNLTL